MTPLVFCRFQPPQLLQPGQHICPAGRQQIELNLNSAIGMDDHFVQQISAEQLIVGVCFGDHLKMGLNVVCEIPNIIFQRVQVAQCFKLFFQRLDLLIIWKFRYPITLRKCLKCNAKIYIILLPGWFYDIEVRNARPAECD